MTGIKTFPAGPVVITEGHDTSTGGRTRPAGKRSRRKAGTVIEACGLERVVLQAVEMRRGSIMCTKSACSVQGTGPYLRLRMFEGVEPMGRGRAKAKQVKVARQLKYNSGGTDLDRLRTELGVGEGVQDVNNDHAYADLADRYSDFDEEDDEETAEDG